MPPQRRKIVPPTTTAKGRRPRVAGSGSRATTSREGSGVEPVTDDAATGIVPESTDTSTPVESDTSAADQNNFGQLAAGDSIDSPETADPGVSDGGVSLHKSASDTVSVGTASTTTATGWPSRGAVIGIASIAAVLGIFATVAAFQPGGEIDNTAWVNNSATSEVSAAVTGALQTLYTYKADSIDEDFDKARAVLNPQMLEEFNKTADTTKSAVLQTTTETEASVTDIGVVRLEADKAELLVNLNVSAAANGVPQGSAQGPLTVNAVNIDGVWLLSGIDDQ